MHYTDITQKLLTLGLMGILMAISAPAPVYPSPASTSDSPLDLSQFLWQNRLLLIFSPSQAHTEYQRQARFLGDQGPQLEERDLLVIQVVIEGSSQWADHALNQASEDLLRQRYQVEPDQFAVILVGKDGTSKRRSEQAIPTSDLYAQIDSMPMRQREMQQRSEDL